MVAPALATLGVGLIGLSIVRRWTIVRIAALLLVGVLAAGEWWFLLAGSRVPCTPAPSPRKSRSPRSRPPIGPTEHRSRAADLVGEKDTVLVFFRGLW